MQLFDPSIIEHINPHLNRNDIHFIGLGKFDFQCAFDISFQNTFKIALGISEAEYIWKEGKKCEAPVWLLVGQIPTRCVLENSDCLKLDMQSGDYIKLYTEESRYECCTFEFPRSDEKRVVEIY